MPTAHAKIADSIERAGLFVVGVSGGPTPTWRYTIGLAEAGLPEVLLAGSAAYPDSALDTLIRSVGRSLLAGAHTTDARGILVEGVDVDLLPVNPSWAQRLLVHAAKYYGRTCADAVQAFPSAGWIDVPRTSMAFDPSTERPWRWLDMKWPYACSPRTCVFTDLQVLLGAPIAEVIHEREPGGLNSWTMRADESPASEDEARLVPMGTLLAVDPTVAPTLDLQPGEFAVRNASNSHWQVWDLPRE